MITKQENSIKFMQKREEDRQKTQQSAQQYSYLNVRTKTQHDRAAVS